jgi:hypothetical protein
MTIKSVKQYKTIDRRVGKFARKKNLFEIAAALQKSRIDSGESHQRIIPQFRVSTYALFSQYLMRCRRKSAVKPEKMAFIGSLS